MKDFIKNLKIFIKEDIIMNFNFLNKNISSELYENKKLEFLRQRITRLYVQVIFLLLAFFNFMMVSFEDINDKIKLIYLLRLIIAVLFQLSFLLNKTNIGIFNIICFLENIYNSYEPLMNCISPMFDKGSAIHIFATKMFYQNIL